MLNRRNQLYWTKERVKNGLARFVRDYYQGRESELPPRPHNYRHAVPVEDQRFVKKMRLYPPFQIVLRYYKSFPDAWKDLGWDVEDKGLEYWTKDEVIAGLKRFYEDFKCCPTYHGYLEKAQFTEKYNKAGKIAANGAYNKYPGFLCIRKFFQSMREAWTAAGFDVDQHWEPWSEIEDWFILESVGILPRTEVAKLLKRTVPAIKRRLYDLGRINSKNRWGISVNKAANLLGLGEAVIRKYLEYGFIPYFRGNKVIYLNPADLIEVKEFDWTGEIPEELDKLIRKALVLRLNKILTYGKDWRNHEIYKFHKTKDYLAKRIKNPRKSAFAEKLPDPPNDLQTGDWITLKHRVKQVSEDRKGIIRGIFYSPQNQPRSDGTKRSAWVANVEFPKLKRCIEGQENRVHYNIPLDVLLKAEEPVIESKPLSMNPEAIRSRKRFNTHVARANKRFQEISNQISGGAY